MILAIKSIDMLVEGVLDNGIAFMGKYLEKMLHRSIIITDSNGQIHYPETNCTEAIIDEMYIGVSNLVSGNEYYYQEAERSLFYRVDFNHNNNAFVIVKELPKKLVLEVAAILRENKLPIKCYFSKLNTSNERFEKELADFLFSHSHANLRDILHLSDNEMDIYRPYFVLMIQIEEAKIKNDPAVIRSYAGEYLKREKLKAISVYNNHILAFIIPFNAKTDTAEAQKIDNKIDIKKFKQAIDNKFQITSSIGVGQVYPLLDLEKSFTEARTAIILNRLMDRKDFICMFSQLGIYQAIFSQETSKIRQYCFNTLGKLIEHDNKSDGDLLPTLRKLLDACVNIKATADSLFIHVNTLYYRINKIEQILEIDLAKMDTRVELYTVIKVWDTMQILDGRKGFYTSDSEEKSVALQA